MFTPRLEKPENGNKFYNTRTAGGLSTCIVGKPTDAGCNVLANCVGYALGRFNEIAGAWKYSICGNAEDFWQNKGGLPSGQKPEVGAIICWKKGQAGNSADGAGHVEIVEKVNADGSIVTSASGWNCANPFWTRTRHKDSGDWGATGYTFQGFIYNPAVRTSTGTTASAAVKEVSQLPTLAVGSKGGAVQALQILLNGYGFNVGNADGIFGGQTRKNVALYQASAGISADGVVGKTTWAHLLGLAE